MSAQHNILNFRKPRYANDESWRPARLKSGQVNGLPNLRGVPIATDGVVLVIELGDGRLVDCHLDSWVQDRASKASGKVVDGGIKKLSRKGGEKLFEAFGD